MKHHSFHTAAVMIVLTLTAVQGLPQSTYEPFTFTTLTGGGGYSTNEAGTAARFWLPAAVGVDGAGNLYVVENGNSTISRVTPAGVVTLLAGKAGSFGSANGTGSAARFSSPLGGAVDGAGNVYVADTDNHTVRKVTPAGVVTTLAGLAGIPGSANGIGSSARFSFPNGVAVDSAGNVYVADSGNNTIRKVTPAAVVTTLAGLPGSAGSADGTNTNARFNGPGALAVDSSTNIYVSDVNNNTVRKMTPLGANWVVTTAAGFAGSSGSANGTNSDARFNQPSQVAVDSAGNLYVADSGNNTIRQLTPVATNWVVTTLAGSAGSLGSADGTNSEARFNIPFGVAVDRADNLFVADLANSLVRKMTLAGTNWVVTTLAGTGGVYGSAEGTRLDARFDGPFGVAVDGAKNIYVADQVNHTIRKVTPEGVVTTLAGLPGYAGSADGAGNDARFNGPTGVAVDSTGNVYVADQWNQTIRKVTPTGVVTTLVGLPGATGGDDGTNSQARFSNPNGVAVDKAGNLYVADTFVDTIRKVTPIGTNWVVTTLAGWFDHYGSQNGTGANAWFNGPSGVAVDSIGNVYVGDTFNHLIRKVTPTGVVTTLAGQAGASGSVDGKGGLARFNAPTGIAVDSANNVYVADTYNNTIRKVTPAGVVTTLAGLVGYFGTESGTGAGVRFGNPTGLAVDDFNNVYVADYYFNSIRKGFPAPQILAWGFNNGQFGFVLTGPPGQAVVVEYSTDLLTWLPLWTNTFAGALNFTNPASGAVSNRFYRARLP